MFEALSGAPLTLTPRTSLATGLLTAALLAACGGAADRPEPAAATPDLDQAPQSEPAAADTAPEAALPDVTAPAASEDGSGQPSDAATADGEGPQADWGGLRRDLLIELTNPQDLALLQRIAATLSERRGLPLLHEVPVYLIRRADLGEFFLSAYEEEDLQDAASLETFLRLLQVFDDDTRYIALLQDLYVGLVLGFYDSEINVFIIVSDNDHIARRDVATITHEFVHALQDHHFDLDGAFDRLSNNADAALAFRFILEGDASLSEALLVDLEAELRTLLEPARDRLPGTEAVIPALLQRIFDAPYLEGVAAVATLLRDGDHATIDALLAAPPDSTEQLLHLDKLADREPPLAVADPDLAAALGPDWTLLWTDTLDEFFLRLLLDEEIGGGDARAGADGWGGDRLAVYRSAAGEELLAWRLRWDDAAEGAEFFDALRSWLDRRSGGRAQVDADAGLITWSGEERSYWIQQEPAATWLVVATAPDPLSRVAAALAR